MQPTLAFQACYARLARLSSVSSEDRDDLASQDLIRAVEIALEMAEIPGSLEPHGVTSEDLDVLATMATEQWLSPIQSQIVVEAGFQGSLPKSLGESIITRTAFKVLLLDFRLLAVKW